MSELLSIYWPDLSSNEVAWCFSDSGGVPSTGQGALADMQQRLAGRVPKHTRLWLGGEQLLLLVIQVPDTGAAMTQKVAPYVAEEYIAQPLDSLHWALGTKTAAGFVEVCIIDEAAFGALLAKLAALGFYPDSAAPDFAALEAPAGGALLLATAADRYLLRSNTAAAGQVAGLAGSGDMVIAALIRIAAEKTDASPVLRLASVSDAALPERLRTALPHWQLETAVAPPVPFLERLHHARHAKAAGAINLCQKKYKNPRQFQRAKPGLSYALALLLLAAALTTVVFKTLWLYVQTGGIEDASQLLYSQQFPEQQRSLAAFVDQQQGLTGQTTNIGDIVLFLTQLNDRLASGDLGRHIKIGSIRYLAAEAAFHLEIRATDFPALERLTQALSAHGIPAEILSASQQEQGQDKSVVASLRFVRVPAG